MTTFRGYEIDLKYSYDLGYSANYWKLGEMPPSFQETAYFRRTKAEATADAKKAIRRILVQQKAQDFETARK